MTHPNLNPLRFTAAVFLLLSGCWAASPAFAQESEPLALAAEQRLLIFQSVSAMHKNSAAPPGFRAAVGAQVPSGIELQSMPGAVVNLIPSLKGKDVAMIEKQVVVVDPRSRTVLAVVTQAE